MTDWLADVKAWFGTQEPRRLPAASDASRRAVLRRLNDTAAAPAPPPAVPPAPPPAAPAPSNQDVLRDFGSEWKSKPSPKPTAVPAPAPAPVAAAAPVAALKPKVAAPAPKARAKSPKIRLAVIGSVAAVVIAGVGYILVTNVHFPSTKAAPIATGTATINSRPDGAQVTVDGEVRGVTPLKLSLGVGPHTLELTSGTDVRTIPFTIEAGALVSQYVDMAPAATTAVVEKLDVSSDPSGADVTIDGKLRGATPLVGALVGAGQHEIVVSNGDGRVRRTVDIAKGASSSVFVSLAPTGTSAGYVSIKAPFELQILDSGKLIGTTNTEQLMLPAGRHELELVNDTFAFRTTITVTTVAGKTVSPAVQLPNGSLSINAVPWADAWLDGKSLGTTPLANLSVPIGNHEVVWRHPQLGERRQTVAVTTRGPVRVGMEFGK